MPEQAELPSQSQPAAPTDEAPRSTGGPGRQRRSEPEGLAVTAPAPRIDAVLFDFHGTLAQVEDPITWVRAAAADRGVEMDTARATVLADRLITAGRAGGPVPARVPPHLIEVWAERDLYAHAHRAAYTGLAATVTTDIDGLPEALYERLLRPDGWLPYADALVTLRSLKAAGIAIAVVSNIGFDIRPLVEAFGMTGLIDEYLLSFEVGRLKPDPAIFHKACAVLAVDPDRTLMVGDTPADAAAVNVGCAAYLVPAAGPGRMNGLDAVRVLAGVNPAETEPRVRP